MKSDLLKHLIKQYGEEEAIRQWNKYLPKKRQIQTVPKSNGRNEPLDINEYPIPDRRETK